MFVASTICAVSHIAMDAWLEESNFLGAAKFIAVRMWFLPPFYAYVFHIAQDNV